MSDQSPNPAAAQPQLRVLTQYVRDLSFENPNAPRSLMSKGDQPEIEVRVDVGVERLSETDFEVVLRIGVEAKTKADPLFVIELEYAGLFQLTNLPESEIEAVLVVECPRQIFPFARRIIADVTQDGGFPPLMLDPIDFLALYQQRLAEGQTPPAGETVN